MTQTLLEPVSLDALVVRVVNTDNWGDFERLFESRGGPKACWCMVWRATAAERKQTDGGSKKAAMAARVAAGVPVGLLAYLDGEPVAWCSIAPRSTYRRLVKDSDASASTDANIWSIACFFVVRRLRGQGMMQRLIQAAVAHARQNGATIVEAYPVDPDAPSYRFMGFVPTFEAAGFSEVGREGYRRHVMRLKLD